MPELLVYGYACIRSRILCYSANNGNNAEYYKVNTYQVVKYSGENHYYDTKNKSDDSPYKATSG
jgi:hypothetical protein